MNREREKNQPESLSAHVCLRVFSHSLTDPISPSSSARSTRNKKQHPCASGGTDTDLDKSTTSDMDKNSLAEDMEVGQITVNERLRGSLARLGLLCELELPRVGQSVKSTDRFGSTEEG